MAIAGTSIAEYEQSQGAWHEFRSMWRVSLNQLIVSSRYQNKFRMEMVGHVLIILPVILTAWAFSDGRSSGRLESLAGLPDHFTFVILGFIAFTALGVGNMILQDTHVSGGIAYEMLTGTLERMFVLPVRRLTVVLGIASYYLLLFLFHAVTLFAGAWLIFGLNPEPSAAGLAWAAYTLLALLAVNLSLGIMGAAITLAFKDEQVYLLAIHRPATILSGAYFLVELMPQPFKVLAYVNPIAYCVDGFRGALTGRPLLMDSLGAEMAMIGAIVVGLGMAATFTYQKLMRRMERTGSLSLF